MNEDSLSRKERHFLALFLGVARDTDAVEEAQHLEGEFAVRLVINGQSSTTYLRNLLADMTDLGPADKVDALRRILESLAVGRDRDATLKERAKTSLVPVLRAKSLFGDLTKMPFVA
ncbi:MAG: hypothetical protein ACOC1F_01320 [Myxococcota bacterium]